MIIGLDLDEVLCDLATHMCGHIKDEYDNDHNHNIFGSYDFYANDYVKDPYVNNKIADNLVTQVNDVNWINESLPIPGVPKAVQTLKLIGHEVHILTARAQGEEAHTQRWLLEHQIPVDSVTHIGYGSCKGVVAKEMGLDVFVDDHTYNIDNVLEHTDADIYLVNRPWNLDYTNDRVTRINHVSNLLTVYNRVGEANG